MRTLTPKDGYAIMTALARQATGQADISVVDMSGFISAGETVLRTGAENVFNALGVVIGRTFVATRPYKNRLNILNAIGTDGYTNRMRKISFYSKDALASGFFNTDLFTNLADGFTNGQNESSGTPQSTKSQWEQHQAMPLEMNFAGSTVWDDCITMYEEQIRAAFRDPVELAQFVAGMIQEHGNDIESQKEAFNRMTLLSRMLMAYVYGVNNMAQTAINLTTAFNTHYGTNYTSAQLRTTYLKEFLSFMVAKVKEISDHMTERSTLYHLPMTKTVNSTAYSILRHTPYDRQRILLFSPLYRMAEATVLPEIFRPEYLDIKSQFEPVEFWQNNLTDANRPKIKGAGAYYNPSNGYTESTGNLTLDYVVGCVYDVDSVMVDYQLERTLTTPVEARKGYRNTWLHMSKNAITDPTENFVLLYMDDSGVTPAPEAADNAEVTG